MGLVQWPYLLADPAKAGRLSELFPADAIERAKAIAESVASVGAYSHSQGTRCGPSVS
jgi:hypothetical protein